MPTAEAAVAGAAVGVASGPSVSSPAQMPPTDGVVCACTAVLPVYPPQIPEPEEYPSQMDPEEVSSPAQMSPPQ